MISIREYMSNLKKRWAVDFHIQRTLLALYLSNLLVVLLIQAVFLAILIRALLPKLSGLPIIIQHKDQTHLCTAYVKNVTEMLPIHKRAKESTK